jgi:hypothetical protein
MTTVLSATMRMTLSRPFARYRAAIAATGPLRAAKCTGREPSELNERKR